MDWQAIEAGTLRPVGAAAILGRRIVSGELIPGTTLPNLDDLAVQFSVSRLSMREAIKLLAGKGLVSSAPRRGTIVRPRHEWSRLDPDVMIWQIGDIPSAAFVRNMFELRRMVEPEAAALAAERASSEALADIEHAYARMAAPESDKIESIKADYAFHQRILEGTGNEFIAALAPTIETSLMLTFTIQRGAWADPNYFMPSHQAVLAAIQRGDAEGARRAMQALLVRSEGDAMDGLRLLGGDGDAVQRAARNDKRSEKLGSNAIQAPRA